MHIRDGYGAFPLSIAVDRLGHIVVVVTCALVAALPLLTVIEHHGIIVLRLDIDGVCSRRGRGAVSASTIGLVILQAQTGRRGRAGGWRWRHWAHNATVTVTGDGGGDRDLRMLVL